MIAGDGGEPVLQTDGNGRVYLACHQDARILLSSDWGASFSLKQSFPSSCCDMSLARNGENVVVTYLSAAMNGVRSWVSPDGGNNFSAGIAPSGPLDRQWTAFDPSSGSYYLTYSKGYIGGPPSTGVFMAKSQDAGQNFVELARTDIESVPNLPVDPYVAVSSTGTVYSMFATTSNNDKIDKFAFSYSTDGAASFQGHQTLATTSQALGSTQERWMYGWLTASGPSYVLALYVDYKQIIVDQVEYKPLLVHYRVSSDGGQSFSAAATLTPISEIENAIRSFEANRLGTVNYPYYIQMQPVACVDPYGVVHVAYVDNRDGQGLISGIPNNIWHVRHTKGKYNFSGSQRVSASTNQRRPNLDFMSIAADSAYVYVSWSQLPNSTLDWNFTGNLFVARKANLPFKVTTFLSN